MLLNEDFQFSGASKQVKDAFIGSPEKVPLSPGTKLYKWTDYPLVSPNGITPWWCFVIQRRLPSGMVADGFRRTEQLAARLGTTHRDYQRVRTAVSEQFQNTMQNLLVSELTLACWGFAGKAIGQQEFKDPQLKNVYLIGGKCQVWIPNLTVAHIRQIPTIT
jgi:hypothetical protein